jgi:adenine-specific DNA-methyltransferase
VSALPATDEAALLRRRIAELERENQRLRRGRRYGLVWDERSDDRAETPLPRFVEDAAMAVGQGERPVLLYEGDNRDALRWLRRTHRGAIDVVYIDPPYNTGRADLAYGDRFAGGEAHDRHSAWLSFMAPRLRLAHELLGEHGVLVASIDDNEFAQLKLLLDDVFGEANFIGDVIRATNSTKSNSTFLSINYDHTFFYARDRAALEALARETGRRWEVPKSNVEEYRRQAERLQRMGLPRDEIAAELKELTKYPRFVDFVNYWYVDDRGLYRKGDLGGVKDGNPAPLQNPLTGCDDPVPPGGFRFGPAELERLVADDRIHFHTDGSLPTIKRYLDDNPRQRPKGIMSDDQRPDANLLEAMGLRFDNPKQLAFMRRILGIFAPDATILDFFAGSGTTGHAVLALNAEDGGARQAILCTDDENGICRSVTHPRLRMAIEGYADRRAERRTGRPVEVPGLGGALRFFAAPLASPRR